MTTEILSEYLAETDFAADVNVCQRTVARHRRRPNGIPIFEVGRQSLHSPSRCKAIFRNSHASSEPCGGRQHDLAVYGYFCRSLRQQSYAAQPALSPQR